MSSSHSNIDSATKQALDQHLDKWKRFICSPANIDTEKVKLALAVYYSLHKLPPPSQIVYFDSPIAGAMAASLLGRWTGFNLTPSPRKFLSTIKSNLTKSTEGQKDKLWMAERYLNEAVSKSFGRTPLEIRQAIQIQLVERENRRLLLEGIGLSQLEGSTDAVIDKFILAMPPECKEALSPLMAGNLHDDKVFYAATISTQSCAYGALDPELVFLDYCGQSGSKLSALHPLVTLAQNCGWWWALEDICVITARPVRMRTNKQGRLHSNRGPALLYPDSWGLYAWNGLPVPPRFISFTRNMNSHDIVQEQNVELRRMMLEAYGMEAFMLSSGARKVQQDDCGELWKQEMPEDEPLVMVRVTNSSPEPEGHLKKYFIRVPPATRTAREGVAWTFGMGPQEYNPKKQT
jgi:hypothetical protein